MPALAFHTVFAFDVDRVELDGNTWGPEDGVLDHVDEFDDGALSPAWFVAVGTAAESGGLLHLTSPGTHYPGPDGLALDVSIASSNTLRVADGGGDFTVTSYWLPTIPPLGHHFHFSLFTYAPTGGLYNETFGLAILGTETGLQVEQHLTEIDQSQGVYHNSLFEFTDVTAAEVTGQIVFRLHVDDATNTASSAFSLDGGTTWRAPFGSAPIFVGRTQAQLILSADPQAGPTTPTTTTTSTTLPSGPCSAAGCLRGTVPAKGRLVLADKGGDTRDAFTWKWRTGEAIDGWFDTWTTSFEVCLADGSGATVFSGAIPPGGSCPDTPCWRSASTRGLKYRNPAATTGIAGITLLHLTEEGRAAVTVKARGPQVTLPAFPLTAPSFPLTLRLRTSTGVCWADVFTGEGLIRNTDERFTGRSD